MLPYVSPRSVLGRAALVLDARRAGHEPPGPFPEEPTPARRRATRTAQLRPAADSGAVFRTPGTALTPAARTPIVISWLPGSSTNSSYATASRSWSVPSGSPTVTSSPGCIAGLHARLSPDSIYWRYFGFKSALSPAEIRRFTGIAEEWRFALVGVRIGREGGVHSLEFYTELRNVMIKY